MKESQFINKNQDKWIRFEKMLSSKENNPDELSSLFVEINEDSSHSNTFYKNRIITQYLNKLSVKLFNKVYGGLKNKKGIWYFWKEELPYVAYQCRKELYLCTVLLIISIAVGVISSYVHPEFCRQILGDSYINMTEENIANEDPMAVYKKMKGSDMFFYISLNNIRVSLITFISGLVAGIGSLVVMAHNGIMVGAFQYFFIEKGLFQESFLTIWMHGAIEISLIAVETTAGFVLGKSLLLPGNLPRVTAFKISAKRGVKLLIGSIPLIVLAAIIESIVTRYTGLPNILRLGFILLSFGLVAFIFFINPKRVAKRGFLPEIINEDLNIPPVYRKPAINPISIQGVPQIFSDSFIQFKSILHRYFTPLLLISVTCAIIMTVLTINDVYNRNYEQNAFLEFARYIFGPLSKTFNYKDFPVLFFVNLLNLVLASIFTFKAIKQQEFHLKISQLISTLLCFSAFTLLLQINGWSILFCILSFPFFLNFLNFIFLQNNNTADAINNSLKYTWKTYARFFALQLIFLTLLLLVGLLFNSPLFWIYNQFVEPFLFTNTLYSELFSSFIMYSMYFISIISFVGITLIANGFQLNQSMEIIDATKLKQKIAQL